MLDFYHKNREVKGKTKYIDGDKDGVSTFYFDTKETEVEFNF